MKQTVPIHRKITGVRPLQNGTLWEPGALKYLNLSVDTRRQQTYNTGVHKMHYSSEHPRGQETLQQTF